MGSIWRICLSPWSVLVNSTHWLPKVTSTFTGVSNGTTSGFCRKNRFYCLIVTSVCPDTVLTEQILYFLVAYFTTTLGVFIRTVLTKLQANSYHGTNFWLKGRAGDSTNPPFKSASKGRYSWRYFAHSTTIWSPSGDILIFLSYLSRKIITWP